MGSNHLLAKVSNAAVNIGVQVSGQVPDFSSLECVPRSGLPRAYGDSVFKIKEPLYCFPQRLRRLTLPAAMHKGSNFSPSSPHLLFSVFLMKALLMG